jgi:ABC-type transport system involved in cytochrome bd biosynthesis fused ATPase/permease subunit
MSDLDVLGKRIAITGKTNSGKSQLLRYKLTENLDVFSKVFVICPTEKLNKFYSKLVESQSIFDEFIFSRK